MKDSKLKISAEDIAFAKAIKKLREAVQQEVPPTGSFDDLLEHLAKIKEALETSEEVSKPSRKEREAQRDEAYEQLLQTAAEGKEAGNMVGWLSVPILENEDDTLTSKVGVVLTSSHARDSLISVLSELLEQLQKDGN